MGIIGSWEGYATSPLYLFNNGTLGNSQKGITSTQGDCIISGSNIILNNDPYAGRFNIFRFNDKVDLTSYKYLKALCRMSVTAPQSTYMILFIHTDANVSSTGTSNSYASVTVRYTSNGTAIIDISSFNGFYYVYFLSYTTYSNDRVYVNQVYLSMT